MLIAFVLCVRLYQVVRDFGKVVRVSCCEVDCILSLGSVEPEAWEVPADVAGLLEELAGRGLVLGLASNYDSRLRSVLSGRRELARLGGNVVVSSEIGARKPGATFFARVAESAHCQRNEIVIVGDAAIAVSAPLAVEASETCQLCAPGPAGAVAVAPEP